MNDTTTIIGVGGCLVVWIFFTMMLNDYFRMWLAVLVLNVFNSAIKKIWK